jgi:HSP20 family protein
MNGPMNLLSNRLDWLRNEFENAFGNSAAPEFVPALDIREDADRFYVDLEVPGMKPEEIEVTYADQELSIRGERKGEPKEGDVWHRRERSAGAFVRTVRLPSTVDGSKIEAQYHNGVLTVGVPKAEEAKPRKVQIQVNDKK